MRFKNKTNCILTIGRRMSLSPHGISGEITDKEFENNDELQSRFANGLVEKYEGPVPASHTPQKVDARYEMDPVIVNGKIVTDKSTKTPIQYVVADSEGVDSVSMDGGDSVHSLGKNYHQSPDFIESGVDASKYKNGAEAMEKELNREFEESTYDDEDTLSENESERGPIEDADDAIARDASQFLQARGKNGAEVTTAKNMIEQSVTSETAKVNKMVSESLENGEAAPSASHKVTEFLKQPLNAKKFMIAKETDPNFLSEVNTVSQSDTVKQLVQQRLEELK